MYHLFLLLHSIVPHHNYLTWKYSFFKMPQSSGAVLGADEGTAVNFGDETWHMLSTCTYLVMLILLCKSWLSCSIRQYLGNLSRSWTTIIKRRSTTATAARSESSDRWKSVRCQQLVVRLSPNFVDSELFLFSVLYLFRRFYVSHINNGSFLAVLPQSMCLCAHLIIFLLNF